MITLMKKTIPLLLVFVAGHAMAVGERLTGTETSAGGSKVDACAAAKNSASSTAQTQINFLKSTGQMTNEKYKIKVLGCDCDTSGIPTCSADWEIAIGD